jgi:DNA polymerase-3 subunit delta'
VTVNANAELSPVWSKVVGQPRATALLEAATTAPVHAYLFVGPRGAGKRAAAANFAGELLAGGDTDGDGARHRRLAHSEQHPDLIIVAPEGRTLRRAEAEIIITEGSRSPIEGRRKVIVVDRFHTAEPEAAATLLKTIEEPPPSSIFVLLSEEVPPEHVTVASRCVRIDFPPVAEGAIVEHLAAAGVEPERAALIATASGGNVDRAILLAEDERFVARRDAWLAIPSRLDGTGSTVADLVANLRALIDDAQVPLDERQARERDDVDAWEEQFGARGSRRRQLDERHRRETRLLREDELRLGLATLAGVYRDQLLTTRDPAPMAEAIGRITASAEALIRNPNEALLLEALLLRVPAVA